jgi:hypothetical protein
MQRLLKQLITFCTQTLVAWIGDDRAGIRQLKDEDAARKRWHEYLRRRPP